MIKKAEFLISNTDYRKCPSPNKPEFAFIGRSNVGKSSLINMLTNNKSLAKTSGTPGKTQLINHFGIDDRWYMVDLPGYGFAKTAKSNRAAWEKFIRRYLSVRENLQCVFVLIDSRHEPQKNDLDFCRWLGGNGIPFLLVFTKADKISAGKANANVERFHTALLQWFEETPAHFLTSSATRVGCDELLTAIDEINAHFQPVDTTDR